jgi:Rad3-related DNA helicase
LVVGETLRRWLFEGLETLVLTSATLRTSDDFAFLRDRLMLYDAPGLVVDSPFDFEESTLLLLPSDMPPPGAPGYQEALDTALVTLASALAGRSLVLFTSHHGLRTTYHNIRAPLGALGITTLGQGLDGPRHALLERFRDAAHESVLLGTRSFWEGVDVPGKALTCLAIARLPFDVPSDPVFAARAETFEDPFREYAVPLAVLRFRQGFGRLIRTRSDRGVVAVLDSRVLYKSYGHSFLSALPPCKQHRAPLSEMATAARRFLDGEPLEYEVVGSRSANT